MRFTFVRRSCRITLATSIRCGVAAALLLLSLPAPRMARAYEDTTHAGMSAEAALLSQLHDVLRAMGWELGLFEQLGVARGAMSPRAHQRLRLKLDRLDPAGGYRPAGLKQWAVGWLMAGAVLQQLGRTTDQHHFLDPTSHRGLHDGNPLVGPLLGLLATLDGPDSVRQLLTGTAFSLAGMPATT